MKNILIIIVSVLLVFISQNVTKAGNYVTEKVPDKKKSNISYGGALRMNYGWRFYDEYHNSKFGDLGFELFRLDVNAEFDKIFLAVKYRWYADFEAIQLGYIGYKTSDHSNIKLGVSQVPFGILPYSSHSFWFDATYYMGFEDDYDNGVKYSYEKGNFNSQLAFYKNSEYLDNMRYGRYSFDIVTSDSQFNEEINQLNYRVEYKFKKDKNTNLSLGTSLEAGQIFNHSTLKNGNRYAFAVHSDININGLNFQAQWLKYNFNPQNPDSISNETIQMGAFLYPFMVASKGNILNLNIAKTFIIDSNYLKKIIIYNDFSKVTPNIGNGKESVQNVTGVTIVIKDLYIYVDHILGKNMWFSGGDGIGIDGKDSDEWKNRININLGYYF